MMGTVTELANYFNFSPKRQSCLDEKISEFYPQSKVTKLKYLCRTRYFKQSIMYRYVITYVFYHNVRTYM